MDNIQGKHFSITDPKGVNTVIYQVNKTEKEFLKEYPKYTVERLDHTEEIRGDFNKKTFLALITESSVLIPAKSKTILSAGTPAFIKAFFMRRGSL